MAHRSKMNVGEYKDTCFIDILNPLSVMLNADECSPSPLRELA